MAAQPAMSSSVLEITLLANKVFGNEQTAAEWLKQRHMATDDKAPLELISTGEGFERVKTLLLQIEYGVLA